MSGGSPRGPRPFQML